MNPLHRFRTRGSVFLIALALVQFSTIQILLLGWVSRAFAEAKRPAVVQPALSSGEKE